MQSDSKNCSMEIKIEMFQHFALNLSNLKLN